MRHGGFPRAILCAFTLLAACGERPPSPVGPYLAELRERLERLRPEVEQEIGRRFRDVEIVVLPRERIAESRISGVREALAQIENGPRGDDLETEAKAAAESGAEWALASVDEQGRIVLPDPEGKESLARLVLSLFPGSEFEQDPRALDLILLHELVHVHQHRHLIPPAFHKSVRSRADILARRAVLEGHAEYLTRRIAARIGLADTYDRYARARTDPFPKAKEIAKEEGRIAVADTYFAYLQGERFIAAIVERDGYDEAMREIVRSPPSLESISRPGTYLREVDVSRWGPVAEDLRRWLARERGAASLDVLALPFVREMAGEAADGFREGFHLDAGLADVDIMVLIAADESAARDLHDAWTRTRERLHRLWLDTGRMEQVRLSRRPDDWILHEFFVGHWRRNIIRGGTIVIDVLCYDDSELEEGSERLARRARTFLTDTAWRKAWLEGDKTLLRNEDPALRLAAVSRMKRFVADEDGEVRWLGRFYEARDEKKDKEERIASLVSAIEDPDPFVVTRGLRAVIDLHLWKVPWPLLRERLGHEEAAVRREAWALVDTNIGDDDPLWEAPPKEVLGLVRLALDDPDVIVRQQATGCLKGLHDEPGRVDLFRRALTDESWRVRQEALINLSAYGITFPELLPEITELLDERPGVASEALGNLGPAAGPALPRLREILKGTEGRAEAAEAIWRITDDPEPLLAVVRESVAEGTPVGIDAVGGMGAIARPVVPDVAKVLAHDNRWFRITAAKTLGKIGGPEARDTLTRRSDVERDPRVLDAIRKALAGMNAGQ